MGATITGALCLAVAWTAGGATGLQVPGPTSQPVVESADEQAALTEFRDSLARYLTLRLQLRAEIPPLAPTPNAAEISALSDALARAVQRARRRAKRGDFFSPAVARIVQQRLLQSLSRAERTRLLSPSQEDPRPTLVTPKIHGRFPAGDVLATTPPGVLQGLPPLPAELEYRFIGNILILRDIDAGLILDFMSPAIR